MQKNHYVPQPLRPPRYLADDIAERTERTVGDFVIVALGDKRYFAEIVGNGYDTVRVQNAPTGDYVIIVKGDNVALF